MAKWKEPPCQKTEEPLSQDSDDIVAKLGRLAKRAETSKTYVQEFRMMRAEGVADLIHEAMDKIVDLRVELEVLRHDAEEAEQFAEELLDGGNNQ